MTVDTTERFKTYIATGNPATQYGIPFQLYEIDVFVNGSPKIQGVHYTLLDGSGGGSTGTVQFINGQEPPNGQIISLVGTQTIHQPTEYADFDDAPSEVYERSIDQLTMALKEMDEKLGRSLRVSQFDPPQPAVDAINNPNNIVVTNDDGEFVLTPLSNIGDGGAQSAIDAALSAAAAAASASAASGSAAAAAAVADALDDRYLGDKS